MRKLSKGKPQREPTIALINIVFLMLVFFMVAGTLAQPLDPALKLVETADLDGRAPPDALVVHADGRLSYRGDDQPDAAGFLAILDAQEREVVRLVPDRALPAKTLVALTRELRAAGAQKVMLVTERALK
ncbi:biopolymer transporter ExbD [Sulfitobacter sp. M57]|uniref:ExbD/TolR family protein n=1 Tax=unclassified Sulfitobacter TaxID=196795 RepID=UPI0023E15BAC|nr:MULTISPECIES: biopolymer transporter ExbD [unclassified Sulfitobacter]MDF3415101.1 biopolymer transporter ExbD [Sulfitobacter sp. KE5]MDF3422582.1 biopolymer transporter ExbD [Sulfitobacter sp. KE43]MDF3433647.1 biopolymer transporter ExbD [Sulfitobacter sp. KE42]MDF3459287.1 biopolymer transporter ExbD [Sulfitobacter sp. S74]MDF3463186.1 biopolymer transporter ExbD [Sulfitobacter sp. Ks18]